MSLLKMEKNQNKKNVFVIDNYDSFTYNIVQYIGKLGCKVKVFRNDKITLQHIKRLKPSHIIISPGPGNPKQAGISLSVIKAFAGKIPLLGVCLGHQCIAEAFGGKVVKGEPVHGKTAKIQHNGKGIFKDLKKGFVATRYHSLIVQKKLPACLEVTATTQGLIMGLQHRQFNVYGVQFHPESFLTLEGMKLLKNFLNC